MAHQARGYTRITLESQDRTTRISEHVFDTWGRAHGIREVVRSRREATVGWVLDMSADYIDIQGLRFIGLTHPDALEH